MKRNGSALLIVLGVLSFLVVSAVAFSAYMRRARLPSSYLRRSVAARNLAKGALARAIDQIDMAIGDGVHPGVGGNSQNTWRDRVFFMGGPEQDISQTAPTLTFEGLAYIPPPLVNEARYWSRKTPTAVWRSFGYDTGRYAYCAIDVSDYFDVNRLVADYPRSSAANRRITISHFFEDVNHSSAPSGADEWDEFMEKFRDIDDETLEIRFDSKSKMPLVSLADFNLALGDNGAIGRMKSPFVEYLKSKKGGSFYAGDPSQGEAYAAMTFVADGWFPRGKKTIAEGGANGNQAIETYDLADGRYQPYQMNMLAKDKMKLSQAVLGTGLNKQGGTDDLWLERLSGLGCAALADYLDADRTPISLAIPTTERVPMICGICPQLGPSKFSLRKEGDEGEPTVKVKESETSRTVTQIVTWKIDAAEINKVLMGHVQALVVYPFLHKDKDEREPSFEVDGQFSLFFSSTDIKLRTGPRDVLHIAQLTPNKEIMDSAIDPATGVIHVKLPRGNPAMKTLSSGEAETQEDAVWDKIALPLDAGSNLATEFNNAGREFLKLTYTWKQTCTDPKLNDWTPTLQTLMQTDVSGNSEVTVEASCGFPALKSDGTVDEDFTTRLLNNVKNPNWSKAIKLNAAVWLRVVDRTDTNKPKVVDLVPACISDDSVQNGVNDPDTRVEIIGQDEFAGKPYPLMRFDLGVELNFGVAELLKFAGDDGGAPDIQPSPKAVMVADPRFNYAPEHWFKFDSDNLTANEWIQNNHLGGNHDGDIFLATSDAGYMQSIYELAFIPRFTNLRTVGNSASSGNLRPPDAGTPTTFAARGSEQNHEFMWTSYDPLDLDEGAFNDMPFTSEGTGMKVNPYSDSTNVLMAAFANTPVDWRRASTNVMEGATDYAGMTVKEFNQKYAWNGYKGSPNMFAWEDLEKVAGEFMRRVRVAGNSGWKTVWNDIDWFDLCKDGKVFSSGGDGMQMTGDTDELWDADRKFLYGFWRDCFAAKQQLFLVFVRAEPLMLGGGTADQMPPQLGARAVALVWRDPTASDKSNNGYPHRTRILFYRPLD